MINTPDQRIGQGAEARSDLDHAITTLRRDGIDDVGDHLLIDQKILAKTFARYVLAHWVTYPGKNTLTTTGTTNTTNKLGKIS
jgi:hypothetical protein